jgi:thioredoxin-like negative regulator of GroEL
LNLQLDGFFGLDDSKITLDDIDHMDSRVVTKLHIIKRDDAYEHTIAVEVRTTPEHGQFECSREAATDSVAHLLSSKFDNLILLGKNTRRVEFLSLCYLTLYKNPDTLKEYLQKIGNHFQLNGFLYLPIENPDYVSGQLIPTLEQIFYDRQVPSGEQTLSRHALRLCLNLCTNAPDTNRRQMCQLRVYTLFASLYPFQAQDIELGQVYKDALALAKSIMKSEESYEAVRLLLEALLGQGYGYRAILQEASSLSGNKPHLALPLFDLLIKKGIFKLPDKKFSQILSTVYRNAIDKLRESHPDDTLDLLRALVENEQAYDLALESARTAFKDGNERGLQLFKALFEKNKGYEEAIETASQMIESNQRAALRLFKALFEEGQGYQQALEAARKAQKNGQLDIALELFEALVEKGQGYNEAVKAASQALKNGYINDALELFIILVKKEQGYNEAIKAASQGLDRYPYTALQLFKILTEKGQGYNEAVKAASQALKNGYINDALELFIILVKKEQGYNEAIKAASQAFAAEVTAHSALQLFKALLEGGRGYQQALEAALEAWNQNRVADARELSIELLKNVETYDRAVRSASKGLKDGEPGASGLLRKLVQIPQELVTHNVPDLDKPTESDDDKKKLMTSLALALNTFEFLVNLDHGYQEAQNAAQMVRQRVNHKGLKNKADRLAQLVQEKTTPR